MWYPSCATGGQPLMMREAPAAEEPERSSIYTVVAASAVGTTIEWYDFLIYSTAASLVFSRLFFPTHDLFVGKLLAMGTIGVGFVARPVGAVILSHFGDRVGRKSVLILTLVSMGISTMLIGVLPTYERVGVIAPVLLVTCRLIQGFAVGGEWGGAVLMAIEHSPPNRRGLYGSIVQMGLPLGLALGTASFFALAKLNEGQFMSWGWRLPFLASAALVALGTFIRLRVAETPDFIRARVDGQIARFPVLETVRRHPKYLLIGLGARITELSWFYVISIFGLSYAVTNVGIPRQLVLGAIALGATLELITIPLFGSLSDRWGRRPIYMLGCLAAIAMSFPFFWAIDTRAPSIVVLGFVIGMSLGHGVMYGVQASFLSEMFPSNVRCSGASLGYQLAAPIGGGVVPALATAMVGVTNKSTWPVSVLMISFALVTILTVRGARETSALANARSQARLLQEVG